MTVKYIKVLLFIFICFSLDSTFAQMQMDWARRYHGAYNGGDGARAIKVDDSGNVYVTGGSQVTSSSYECLTIKYNKFGDSLWVRHYQRSMNSSAIDIETDDSGNVFVSCGAILKYNPGGDLIWAKYDSAGYRKIILDSSGNIYGGGTSQSQLTTGKYDKDGNRIWKKKYSFSGSAGQDAFGDFTKDNYGNLIITGRSRSASTDYDYATIKYSNDGDLIWSRRYNGPSSYSFDASYGIASDVNGNIYVTGSSMDSLNNDNCVTVKYDSSGNVLWVKRITSGESIANAGYKLSTDSSQNVFIAGRLGGRTSTIKLDVNGNVIWYRIYSEGNALTTNFPVIVLDSDYNVYVTGNSTATGLADYAAIKYDSSGNQKFIVTYNYLSIGADYAIDMALDKGGVVYLTGESQAGGGYAYATVKFSPIPTYIINNNSFPTAYKLEQNYPNPFNPSTSFQFNIPKSVIVSIKVYDICGREISTLINEFKNAGSYEIKFDGSNLSSGVYYYRIETKDFIETKKMLLLK